MYVVDIICCDTVNTEFRLIILKFVSVGCVKLLD